MHIGIVSPVVVLHPDAHSPWERDAGIADLARIAETADRLGYDHLTCSEHVAVPVEVAAARGGTYWDPLATLGFLAAGPPGSASPPRFSCSATTTRSRSPSATALSTS